MKTLPPGVPSENPDAITAFCSMSDFISARSSSLAPVANSLSDAIDRWCMVVAAPSDGDLDPIARCARTASSAEAPLPPSSVGTMSEVPPNSLNLAIASPSLLSRSFSGVRSR
jgi:hypothetical protein